MAGEDRVPWPKSEDELLQYMRSLTDGGEGLAGGAGYEYAAEATWKLAAAAFYYASHVHGLTGFQAGWAAMRFLGEVNDYKGPFGVLDGSQLLYPQYDLVAKAQEWVEEWTPKMVPKAKELLAEVERGESSAAPRVVAHWRRLAAQV